MRIKRLDILRCIAVLLVLQSHSELPSRLTLAGYAGVDLFFVLSGFLISGLLFAEYKQRQTINFGRFFIRRSLKIYPSFYALVLATVLYQYRVEQMVSPRGYLGEILYVQNYTGPLWGHEWSLAVEEHFYILLPLFLLLLIRQGARRQNPFWAVPWTFLLVAFACLAFRVEAVSRLSARELQDWNRYNLVYEPTQCRLDGLFFGVLLGYLQHFRSAMLENVFRHKSVVIGAGLLGTALLCPALFLPQRNRLMVTAGLTATYLGFGILLMLSLRVRGILPEFLGKPCGRLGNALATIGMYSYPIYLWHEPVRTWVFALVQKFLGHPVAAWLHFFIYLSTTILVGILFSRLVEYPILKLRDRFLPAIPKVTPAKVVERPLGWQPDQPLINPPSPD